MKFFPRRKARGCSKFHLPVRIRGEYMNLLVSVLLEPVFNHPQKDICRCQFPAQDAVKQGKPLDMLQSPEEISLLERRYASPLK